MNKDDYNDWQQAILCLPPRTFFNLMRLYLGEIKTPFNKQRLVEQLVGFLSKKEMQQIIIKSLDNLDVLILTAVHILPIPARSALLLFFASEFYVQTRLINMEERLLIYCSGAAADKKIYKINPLLYKAIEPLLDSTLFFLPEKTAPAETTYSFADDLILAGLYTFLLKDAAVLKTNGMFKLKTTKQLNVIFPEAGTDSAHFEVLCTGLQHLGLLVRNEAALVPQQERWEAFFQQSPFERKMYIAAAACGHARRDVLHRRAQFFADFFALFDSCGIYSDEIVKRFFFYVFQKYTLENGAETAPFAVMRMEAIEPIDIIKKLRFLIPVDGAWQVNSGILSTQTAQQSIIASPSFEVTILPYTSFEHIFPILNCMEPLSILTTGRFEITRAACSRCFEKHISAETLADLLDKAAGNALPQNIRASISEWYIQCTAVGLYHGFVLSVSEEKRNIFRQNAGLQGIIYKELADGIYLIKQMGFESIRTMIKSAGLELTFYGMTDIPRYTSSRFASIEQGSVTFKACREGYEERRQERCAQEKAYRGHITMLEASLEKLPLAYEDKRNIKEKIAKKLILTEAQLCRTSVDSEIREVSGLDFLGKIHLAETAIAEHRFLEVYVDEPDGRRVIAGIPITVEKTANDAVLVIRIRDTQEHTKVSIARTVKMIALQDSLFS